MEAETLNQPITLTDNEEKLYNAVLDRLKSPEATVFTSSTGTQSVSPIEILFNDELQEQLEKISSTINNNGST